MIELNYFNIFIYIWLALAFFTFIILLFITAPYGRHTRKGWGPSINPRFGWILMEIPSVLLFALFFILGDRHTNIVCFFFLLMWEVHYIQRTFIYPLNLRKSAKKMPFLIIIFSLFFNSINCYLNGRYLFTLGPVYNLSWLIDPRFLIGTGLFVIGFLINLKSDRILFKLRDQGNGYQIPKTFLYKWISCPNYFGEILEWIGWAIATWSLPGLTFAVWTIANLLPRAISNHKWYMDKFEDYPKNRKIIFPFFF
ncbi:MAG: DUF1295 domain-containing protein [Pseudomonadota bacterium]